MHVTGSVTGLDQLRFALAAHKQGPPPDPVVSTVSVPSTPAPVKLPIKVGLQLPTGIANDFIIGLDGITAGNAVAHTQTPVTLTNGHASITMTLVSGTALDMSEAVIPDMTLLPDLRQPDLMPPSIQVTAPDGGTVYELETLTFTVQATDPLNESVTLAVGGIPDLGTSQVQTGNTLTVTMQPGIDAAGVYAAQLIVTAMNAMRSLSLSMPLAIFNGVDPVFPINPMDDPTSPNPPANMIGDFDGDGHADLASCSVVVGANTVYHVDVLYGDDTGLPLNPPPLPPARVKEYTLNGTTASAMSQGRLNCTGADMDGDGKSDVIISDPLANAGKGMIYIMFGTGRVNDVTTGMPIMTAANLVAGEVLGQLPVFVGHYGAGGVADIATETYPTGGDNIYIFLGKMTRPPAAPFATGAGIETHAAPTVACGVRTIIGFGDIDKSGLDQLMVWDKNVGGTAGCPGTVPAGGWVVIKTGVADAPFVRPSPEPAGYGNPATLCDVDGDGHADLVVPDGVANGSAQIYLAPFTTVPATNPPMLDIGRAARIPASPAGHSYADARCFRNFIGPGPQTLLLVDPGVGGGKARVDITTNSTTPTVARQLPDPAPGDTKYGRSYAGAGDVNADGKRDVVVGTPSGGKHFLIYGR